MTTLRQELQAATGKSLYRTALSIGVQPSTMYAVLRGRLAASKAVVEKFSAVVPNVQDFFDPRGMVRSPD